MQPSTPTKTSLPLAALKVAQAQVGVREKPPGSNRGAEIDEYLRRVGLDPAGNHYSYCAAGLYWCFDEAAKSLGIINPVIRTAGCLDHWAKAFKPTLPHRIAAIEVRGNPSLAKPGMIGILVIDAHTQAGHEFIIESVEAKTGIWTTIEFNSNDNGSSDGEGVFRLHKRSAQSHNLIGLLDYTAK